MRFDADWTDFIEKKKIVEICEKSLFLNEKKMEIYKYTEQTVKENNGKYGINKVYLCKNINNKKITICLFIDFTDFVYSTN